MINGAVSYESSWLVSRLLVEVRPLARGDYWREEPKHPIKVSKLFGELILLRCVRLITCERCVITSFRGQESDARGAIRQID